MVRHTCSLSTQEAEEERLWVQGQPGLQSMFKATSLSLIVRNLITKKKKKKKANNRGWTYSLEVEHMLNPCKTKGSIPALQKLM
jgi:hypothetical protein